MLPPLFLATTAAAADDDVATAAAFNATTVVATGDVVFVEEIVSLHLTCYKITRLSLSVRCLY